MAETLPEGFGASCKGFLSKNEMSKAALYAADESNGATTSSDATVLVVQDRHLDEALRELALLGGELTRSILGFAGGPSK